MRLYLLACMCSNPGFNHLTDQVFRDLHFTAREIGWVYTGKSCKYQEITETYRENCGKLAGNTPGKRRPASWKPGKNREIISLVHRWGRFEANKSQKYNINASMSKHWSNTCTWRGDNRIYWYWWTLTSDNYGTVGVDGVVLHEMEMIPMSPWRPFLWSFVEVCC